MSSMSYRTGYDIRLPAKETFVSRYAPVPEQSPLWKRALAWLFDWCVALWRGIEKAARWLVPIVARWWRHSSANTRIAGSLAAALLLLWGGSSAIEALWPAPSFLRVSCAYSFQAAQIIVSLDDKEVMNEVVVGPDEPGHPRNFAIFRRASGNYTQTIRVPAGPHRVSLRVASTEEPFDRSQSFDTSFSPGETTPLEAACNRNHMVAAVLAAVPNTPQSPGMISRLAEARWAPYFGWLFFSLSCTSAAAAAWLAILAVQSRAAQPKPAVAHSA
jgi:hypothetical protein